MATVELRAQRRAVLGKKVRFLRREGQIPASLYGPGVASLPLQLPARETELALRRISTSTLVPLHVDGEPVRRVLVREIQRHPTGEQVLHLDLFAVSMNEVMRASVPIHVVGEAPAVNLLDGTLIHSLEAVEVEALPTDLPARLDVDVSGLDTLHSMVHVSDLAAPPGVTILTPADSVIVSVSPPRLAAEELPEAAAEAAPAAAAAEEAPAAEESSEAQPEGEAGS
jgi:large subunit ribosomal protein L25